MYSHLLVPISGDGITKKFLKEVANLAKKSGAQITLVYISDPLPPEVNIEVMPAYTVSSAIHKKACEEFAKRLFKKAKSQFGSGAIVNTCHLFHPNVFDGIIEAAKKNRADVIVMASHKRRGLERIFMGSNTHAVILHTSLPVLVI